jgi:hypothetical protein
MELFFHAMSGREGVSDTAMSTAKSGYIQRKIVKVCEDIQVQYDQTVRDATGKIYQFAYGEDNYDPVKTIRVGGTPAPCDISRIADRLNISFELGIEDKEDEIDPLISSSIIQDIQTIIQNTSKSSPDKQNLIDKIRKHNPSTIVDEDWTLTELRQRLQAIDLKDDSSDDLCDSESLDENITTLEELDEEHDEEHNPDDIDEDDDIDSISADQDDDIGDFDGEDF